MRVPAVRQPVRSGAADGSGRSTRRGIGASARINGQVVRPRGAGARARPARCGVTAVVADAIRSGWKAGGRHRRYGRYCDRCLMPQSIPAPTQVILTLTNGSDRAAPSGRGGERTGVRSRFGECGAIFRLRLRRRPRQSSPVPHRPPDWPAYAEHKVADKGF